MIDFNETIELLKKHKLATDTGIDIQIPNAEELFYHYFKYFLGSKPIQMAKEYGEVIQWLNNNEGKSLYLYGNNGRGKTIIGTKVIPAIFMQTMKRVFTVVSSYELAEVHEEVKNYRFLTIDDLGSEPTEVNNYGTKRSYINEMIDQVEKKPRLYIITSNLGKDKIIEKYGIRTYDRIVGNFKRIYFGTGVESGKGSFRNL